MKYQEGHELGLMKLMRTQDKADPRKVSIRHDDIEENTTHRPLTQEKPRLRHNDIEENIRQTTHQIRHNEGLESGLMNDIEENTTQTTHLRKVSNQP